MQSESSPEGTGERQRRARDGGGRSMRISRQTDASTSTTH